MTDENDLFDHKAQPAGGPPPEKYWRSRRRIAASAMIGLLSIQIFTFLSPDITVGQKDLLSSIVWVHATIIGAYIGFKMVEKGFGKR